MDRIETVGDLIAALECYDPDTRIRLASQPGWPFESGLAARAVSAARRARDAEVMNDLTERRTRKQGNVE
jgi:hypothetical protein